MIWRPGLRYKVMYSDTSQVIIRLLIAGFCCSCSNLKDKQPLEQPIPKRLPFEFRESVAMADLIEPDYTLVPLLADSANMIGAVSKIVFKDSLIYIMDGRITQKIYVYDTKGRFKYSFGELGSGPGEYNTLTEMIVTGKNIYASDGSDFTLLCYLPDGTFQYEMRLDYWLYEALPYNRQQLLVYAPTDLSFNSANEALVLKIIDADLITEVAGFFPYQEAHDDVPFRGYLCAYNNTYSFARPLYNKIYSLDSARNLYLRYELDFGVHNWPISVQQISQDPEESERLFREGGIMSIVHRLLETKEQMVFQVIMMPRDNSGADETANTWLCIIDKSKDKAYAMHTVADDSGLTMFTFPIATAGNRFVSVLYPELFNEFLGRLSKDELQTLGKRLADPTLIRRSYQNPVLLIYRFKAQLNI